MTFWQSVADALRAMSPWEVVAVMLAIAYLVLAIRQNIWCWACAAVSTAIYFFLFGAAMLKAEAALQIFYLLMAGYGWYEWRFHPGRQDRLPVTTWRPHRHLLVLGIVAGATGAFGWYLSYYTQAALPYLDAFTSSAAVVATYMVARKVLENWVYWFVIDAVSIYLYLSRDLHLTAVLFFGYLILIPIGFNSWLRDLRADGVATRESPPVVS